MIRLERVLSTLPSGLDALRAEAGASGHRMLDRLASEWESGENRFDRPGEALYAAYVGDALAGIGGLTLEPAIPGAYRMRRFFISPRFRRSGVGRTLALAVLNGCDGQAITANAAAGSEAFWEALGFIPDRRERRTHVLHR